MLPLSIVYLTSRLDPKFEWFVDSLARQCDWKELEIIAVDFHAENPDRQKRFKDIVGGRFKLNHTTPHPSVWQGKYRLTKADYFDAANASNTGISMCPTEWVAFVDDLSVLMPGWFDCVKEAITRDGITCGSYKKVHKLNVENGEVKSFEEYPGGNDIRRRQVEDGYVHPCTGQWFFGCSFVAKILDLLKINGFDMDTSGMRYQDVVAGRMLDHWGQKFWYDTRMITYESEEDHHNQGKPFESWDPGKSPDDKSHKILELVKNGRKVAPNYYPEGGLKEVRMQYFMARKIPYIKNPQHEWFTGLPISELGSPPPKFP